MISNGKFSKFTGSIGVSFLSLLVILLSISSPTPAAGAPSPAVQSMEKSFAAAFSAAFRTAKTSTSVNTKLATVRMNISLDNYFKCAAGGSIHTIGSWGGLVTTKQVFLSGQFHQTILNWKCVKGWIINGDPYLSYTASQFGSGSMMTVSYTRSGGWLGKGKSGSKLSCQARADGAYNQKTGGHVNVHAKCIPGGSTDFSQLFQ